MIVARCIFRSRTQGMHMELAHRLARKSRCLSGRLTCVYNPNPKSRQFHGIRKETG